MYELTVITWGGSGVQFHQAETYNGLIDGDVPHVGDILTLHPDGEISDRSFTCNVTGVQRVLKDMSLGMSQTSVHVTAKIQV